MKCKCVLHADDGGVLNVSAAILEQGEQLLHVGCWMKQMNTLSVILPILEICDLVWGVGRGWGVGAEYKLK